MRMHRISAGLAAAVVLLAVVVGVPALLVGIGAAPTSVPSLEQVRHALLEQDQNMQVLFALLAAIVWFCWAAFTFSTIREIAVAIRTRGRRSARPLPALDWVGRPAAQLVAAVVLLFAAAPVFISATAPTASAVISADAPTASAVMSSETLATSKVATQEAVTTPATGVHDANGTSAASRGRAKTTSYTVQRRDTLWSIAESQLGDPLRWPELAHLNPRVVGPAPDFMIRAGDTLALVPVADDGSGAASEQAVRVETGDTLSQLAAENGAGDWQTIWPANRNRPQPGGAALTNPNHIEPGWTVAVPGAPAPRAPSGVTSAPSAGPTPAPTPQARAPHHLSVVPGDPKAETPGQEPTRDVSAKVAPATPSHIDRPDRDHIGSSAQTPEGARFQIGAFAAGGGLLAAGVMGALLVHRRRQLRNRRTGRTIWSTPPELIDVEKAVVSHGRPAMAKAAFLDAALRSLSAATAAEPDGRLPDVVAVRHGGDQVNLRLAAAHPGPPPAPWTMDESGLWWSVSTEQELPVSQANAGSYLAPLPTLAAVGSDDEGYCWMLDLERAGVISLTGDPNRCLDLARFLAVELSVNTWSDHLSVTMVGFGEELVGLNPARLRLSPDLDAAAVALTVDAVDSVDACTHGGMDVRTGRVRDISAVTLMPHVLLVAPQFGAGSEKVADLLQILTTQRGRTAMSIILAGESALSTQASWSMHLTEAGRLIVPELGLDLIANQLPSHEALGISQMLSQAAEAADEAMPAAAGDQPWQAFCDAAGSLLPEHTLPRSESEVWPQPAGEVAATSLLPLPNQTYLDCAATTVDDLVALAPRVPATVRPAVEAADLTLDEDVAAWSDPNTNLPRLTLLGPVQLRAHGELEKNRVAFYTEIVAYLATRENGATLAQFETAFNLQPTRARSDIRIARNWLGVNPRTGRKHLPDALKSKSGQARGVGIYELEDVLVDEDLFRRLRVRGEARGTEGMADLATALTLVSGAPFDQTRPDGYEWLTEGARMDHHLVCAIVDVAHLVTTHALAAGDVKAARAAAEVAQQTAPYEEIPRLDLVAVREAEGHLGEAEEYLRDQVCNRSDDNGGPEDLSDRTQAIVRHREWLSRTG